MASAIYTSAKQGFLAGTYNLDTDVVKVLPVASEDYTFSAAHTQLSDVTGYAGVTAATLASTTIADGVFDADNVSFAAVAVDGTKDFDALVIYDDTIAGDPLIAYIDGFTAIRPNGGDIDITWGADIFSID